ncbi:MAG: hypothetical protein ACYC2I_09765 [Elusimicrobiales bacterium]
MKFNCKLAAMVIVAAALAACGKKPKAEKADPAYLALAQVRAAVQAYYNDHEGKFPDSLDELTRGGRYLKQLPKAPLAKHRDTNAVLLVSGRALDKKHLTDAGGYAYYNSDKYPDTKGAVVLNCTHADKKGAPVHSH